ncbi:MAG: BACON domain-containing carbohydrate-binding protein [Bryobacteraceae bacterium]
MRLLLLLAAAARLFAQTCSYSYAPVPVQPISITASASTNSITITAPAGCAWSYATDATWITLPAFNTLGTGTGTFTWLAAANPYVSPRTGHIVVTNGAFNTTTVFTVVQGIPTCAVTLSPASGTAVVAGVTGTFQVQTNCVWAAGSNANWIALTAPASGTLNGAVGYTVAANACVSQRSGTAVVYAGSTNGPFATFSLVQDGSLSNLTLAPSGLPAAPSTGANGRITLTTGAACSWSAYSDVGWMSITGASSGTGAGSIGYNIIANTSVARTGNIHVGPLLFTVTQQATPAPAVQLNAILNGGSYAQGAISPGEVVAVFGVNIGPLAQVQHPAGSFPTTLGNVQVLFGGVPAPLIFVSATQVNAVVPYAASGSTQAQVQYQSTASNTLTLAVQAATPGLLSLDSTGMGPGAILNQDSSINTAANPAPRGQAIMIYCVGGGVTSPPSTDGAIITAPAPPALPPVLTQAVSVTIGGINANVLYSGAAPDNIAGLTQINAVIPAGVTPGANVPLAIRIGNWQSQTTVTVAVQ